MLRVFCAQTLMLLLGGHAEACLADGAAIALRSLLESKGTNCSIVSWCTRLWNIRSDGASQGVGRHEKAFAVKERFVAKVVMAAQWAERFSVTLFCHFKKKYR